MNKYRNISIFAFLIVILSACASGPPTEEELAAADYGEPISQEHAQQMAEQFLSQWLYDPNSAQYQWDKIFKGYLRHPPIHGGGVVFGYILDVNVNSKSKLGFYTGFKPFRFVFYSGTLKTVYGQQAGASYMVKIY